MVFPPVVWLNMGKVKFHFHLFDMKCKKERKCLKMVYQPLILPSTFRPNFGE